jgi:hypothetical protein
LSPTSMGIAFQAWRCFLGLRRLSCEPDTSFLLLPTLVVEELTIAYPTSLAALASSASSASPLLAAVASTSVGILVVWLLGQCLLVEYTYTVFVYIYIYI